MPQPELTGVYLFVRDMDAAVAFYQRLGLKITRAAGDFASAAAESGLALSFGTAALTRGYDPNWREPSGPGTNTLNFTLASRDSVDAKFAELVAAGYSPHLLPIDAFWGSRFAIIDDPDTGTWSDCIALWIPIAGPHRPYSGARFSGCISQFQPMSAGAGSYARVCSFVI